MWEIIKRLSHVAGIVRASIMITALFAGAAFYTTLAASWEYLSAAPWPIWIALILGALAFFFVAGGSIWLLAVGPKRPGIHTPLWLHWFKVRPSRVSWDFDNYLGLSGGTGQPVIVGCFQVKMRVNGRSAVRPVNAFIEGSSSGARYELLIEGGSRVNPHAYGDVRNISEIPVGHWFRLSAAFARKGEGSHSEGMTKEAFFQEFDGLRLVFEFDNGRFERRFSRSELIDLLDGFWGYSNLPPKGGPFARSPHLRVRATQG